jgi:hypothetical protein
MNNDERTHRYAMMGVVAYVQERIIMFEKDRRQLPEITILGQLEWEVLGANMDEDFSIAGIPCVPDLTTPFGVFFR